ncbi:SufE family protein [Thiotrichales bacterium 19S9-12]|nr:SufE family protein [Thiotrichales bacterium 19S9-11]MCF6812240.1 SufE family protein [Thiotrichales bacterium 19S9-12]
MNTNITEKQKEVVENFEFFEDWQEKYAYLIGLGKSLETFPEEKKNDEHLIKGCQSLVWFDVELRDDGLLYFRGISDAAIVSGLIGLLIHIYSGQSPEAILASEPEFIKEIGLEQHLSPTRNNGLYSMLKAIKTFARDYANV